MKKNPLMIEMQGSSFEKLLYAMNMFKAFVVKKAF
jgi:hypothetical protein